MSKRNKIIYWISTVWLCFGMTTTAIFQLMQNEEVLVNMDILGYPHYILLIIGIWKILGVIALLLPNFKLLKECAYAGFFFLMSGAIISHIAAADELFRIFGPSLLLVLTVVSWYFRPESKKIIVSKVD